MLIGLHGIHWKFNAFKHQKEDGQYLVLGYINGREQQSNSGTGCV